MRNELNIILNDSSCDSPTKTTSGGPQGGCVSAVLYTIFVLDLRSHIPHPVKYLQYVDDLRAYLPIQSDNGHQLFQQAVSGVQL